MKKINKRHHADYSQISTDLPKDLIEEFKHCALVEKLSHSEAVERAITAWIKTVHTKMQAK